MENLENQNLSAVEETGISILNNDTLVQMAQMAEQRVRAMNTIKLHALKATNKNDWINEGGKPYLQESGSCKIARVFGISWQLLPPTKQLFADGNYEYVFDGNFFLGAARTTASGSRSSKSDFFTGKKNPKPVSEIDEGDVRKSAYSNCIGRGVKELLGLGNLTWEDLATAGIKKEDCKGFEFDNSNQEMSDEAKDLRKELGNMLMEMGGNDSGAASRLLATYTTFPGRDGKDVPGKTKLEDLSEKAIPVTYQKVKKVYDEWKAGKNGQPSDNKSNS